jgi:hypothetical protein
MKMNYKGEIYRLKDGKSHLCISENERTLVFAQVYYTDPSHAIMEVNLDNVQLVDKAETKDIKHLEKLTKKYMELKFTIA